MSGMSEQTLPPWEVIQGMVSTLQPGFDQQNKNEKLAINNIRQEARFHVKMSMVFEADVRWQSEKKWPG